MKGNLTSLMLAIFSVAAFAATPPEFTEGVIEGLPATLDQMQVLRLKEKPAEFYGFEAEPSPTAIDTYRGMPVSPHQLKVLKIRSNRTSLASMICATMPRFCSS